MSQPLVDVCMDGCQYEYLPEAAESGSAPFIGKLLAGRSAFRGAGRCQGPAPRLRNFDVLDIALNHLEAHAAITAAAD